MFAGYVLGFVWLCMAFVLYSGCGVCANLAFAAMFSCIVSLLMCYGGGMYWLAVVFSGRFGLLLFGLGVSGFCACCFCCVWILVGVSVAIGGSLYWFLGFCIRCCSGFRL